MGDKNIIKRDKSPRSKKSSFSKKTALTLVIFGGTGDLVKLKLAPAFAELIHEKILKSNSTIIGLSRGDYTNEAYRKLLMSSVKNKKEKYHLRKINVRHVKMNFSSISEISKLGDVLRICEPSNCNRIYYLATSFKFFPTILSGLRDNKLISKKDSFNKIIFEKPFSSNMKLSDNLEMKVHKIVDENHIFRVDHYLVKESVQNLLKLNKKNLNKKNVKIIEIIADEYLGIKNRVNYYNDVGAVKDMVQSHLLQVLALVLMKKPKKHNAKNVGDEKVKVLKKFRLIDRKKFLFGQYSSYLKEVRNYGIKKSKTETFARIFLECNNFTWKGVKIIIRTGKKLPKKRTLINIFFRNGKKKVIILNKCGRMIKNDYRILLQNVIKNNKRLFVRSDALHEMWRIADMIEKVKNKKKIIIYENFHDPEKSIKIKNSKASI